jgi:hypothetical protein
LRLPVMLCIRNMDADTVFLNETVKQDI